MLRNKGSGNTIVRVILGIPAFQWGPLCLSVHCPVMKTTQAGKKLIGLLLCACMCVWWCGWNIKVHSPKDKCRPSDMSCSHIKKWMAWIVYSFNGTIQMLSSTSIHLLPPSFLFGFVLVSYCLAYLVYTITKLNVLCLCFAVLCCCFLLFCPGNDEEKSRLAWLLVACDVWKGAFSSTWKLTVREMPLVHCLGFKQMSGKQNHYMQHHGYALSFQNMWFIRC